VAEFPNSMSFSGPQKLATPEEVVTQSLQALEKNESTVVTGGLGNQLIVNIPRFLPRETLVSAIEKQFKFS
jgi:short-subunit dehydrogenase